VKITEGVPGREGVVIYHEFGTWWFVASSETLSLLNPFFSVKKTKSEIAAQRASHAAKEKLRKERREEQEQNVQRKKALVEKSKADAPGAIGEVADDEDEDEDGSSKALSDEDDDDDDGGEASWDEDDEVSEGEVSEDDDAGNEDCSSDEGEDEPEIKPPRKKAKTGK